VFLPFHQQLLALAVDVFVVLVVDLGSQLVKAFSEGAFFKKKIMAS
jgi:hypothetical protein